MVAGFHSAAVIPVRVAAVGPAVGAAAAGAAAVVAAGGALVAGGAAAGCELRLLQASRSGTTASAPPVAKLHFRNDRRLTLESDVFGILATPRTNHCVWFSSRMVRPFLPRQPTYWHVQPDRMREGTYVAAIDQGTTSTRCMIFDHAGSVVAVDQKEHEQIYPRPGWVEHNPEEIWQRTQQVVVGALEKSGLRRDQLDSVGVTNQRETTVAWYRRTGTPIYNAIVWQDTRTDQFVNELARQGGQDRLRDKTGLPLATYF